MDKITPEVKRKCKYSKRKKQPKPRLCIICGEPELTSDIDTPAPNIHRLIQRFW